MNPEPDILDSFFRWSSEGQDINGVQRTEETWTDTVKRVDFRKKERTVLYKSCIVLRIPYMISGNVDGECKLCTTVNGVNED